MTVVSNASIARPAAVAAAVLYPVDPFPKSHTHGTRPGRWVIPVTADVLPLRAPESGAGPACRRCQAHMC